MTAERKPRLLKIAIGKAGGRAFEFAPVVVGGVIERTLTMSAEIARTSGRKPNKATVQIYNLSDASLSWLEEPNLVMRVSAGEGFAAPRFQGDVSRRDVITRRNGVDIVTEIKASDGRRKWRDSLFVKSYPKKTTLKATILPDILAAMGATTGFVSPNLPDHTFVGSLAFAMRARDALTEVLKPVGGSWSFQFGAVEIMADGETRGANAVILSPETGLIGSPEKTNKDGARFRCLYNPALRPNGAVLLQSRILTGEYRVAKVTDRLAVGQMTDWRSEGEGVPLKP